MAGWLEQIEGGAAPTRAPESATVVTPQPEIAPTPSAGWLPAIERPDPSLSVENALGVKPEAALKARQQSEALGLPLEAVEADPELIEREVTRQQTLGWLADAPATSRAFEADPQLAREASDSVEKLSRFEQAIGNFFSTGGVNELGSLTELKARAAQNIIGDVVQLGGNVVAGVGDLLSVGARSLARAADQLGLDGIADAARSYAQLDAMQSAGEGVIDFGGLVLPDERTFGDEAVGATAALSAQLVAAIYLGPAAAGFFMGAAEAHGEAEKAEEAGAAGTAEADLSILVAAATAAGLERAQAVMMLDRIPQNVRSRFGRILAGMTTEGVQEVAENVIKNFTAIALYDESRAVVGEEDIREGGLAAIAAGFISAVIPGRQALSSRDRMAEAQKEIAGSPLAERDPATAARLAADVLKENDVSIRIPVAKLDELAAGDETLYQNLGVTEAELTAARERDGDVRISEDAFAREFMLDPERFESVADFVKYGDAEMNADEAQRISEETTVEAPAQEVLEPEKPKRPQTLASVDGVSVFQMTPEELEVAAERAKEQDKTALARAFGSEEIAADFIRLDRAMNSSNEARAEKATKEFEEKFGDLTPEQERAAYGIGETAISPDGLAELAREAHNLAASEPAEIIRDMAFSMRRISPDKIKAILRDGEGGNETDFVHAYKVLNGIRVLRETGQSQDSINEGIINAMRDVGFSEADALEVLSAYLNSEKPAAATPEAPALPAPSEPAQDGQGAPVAAKTAPDAIAVAEEQLGLQALFTTAAEAGLTASEYQAYLATKARAGDAARKKAEEKVLKRQQQEASAEWQAERAKVEEEMRESVSQEPVYNALNAIQAERIDREALVEIIGKDALDKLPKQGGRAIFAPKREKGIHPEALAERFGFEGADIMLFAMMDAKPFDERVAEAVEAEMTRRHGSLNDQRQQIEDAIEALHNEDAADALAYELAVLQQAKKAKALKASTFQAAAKQGMLAIPVGDIDAKRFLTAERKKAKEAGQLLRGGKKDPATKKAKGTDRAGAVRAKYQQLLNFQYAREAYAVRRQIDKDLRLLKRFQNPNKKHPTIAAEFVDQIRGIVGRYDLSERRTQKPGGAIPYRSLSYGEFREMAAKVRQLRQQGTNQRQLFMEGKRVEFALAKLDMLESVDRLPDLAREERKRVEQNPRAFDRARRFGAGLQASVAKVELFLQKLDGAVIGPWHRAIFKPIVDAQTADLDMKKAVLKPMIKGLRVMPKAVRRKHRQSFYIPALDRTFRGSEILAMALNVGNVSNYTKMIEGSKKDNGARPWSPDGIEQALAKLGPEEAQWVQSVWDAFETLRPAVEQVYRDENGSTPARIEPRSVTIGGVTLKGGYFPMMYDPDRAPSEARESTLDLLKNEFFVGSVFSGMTQNRIESFSAPVLLDLEALPGALEAAMHFVTHYEAVKNVRKVLTDKELGQAVTNKLGLEYHKELNRWLEAVATKASDRSHDNKQINAVAQYFRTSMTAAILGASYTTLASQVLGLSTTVSVLGRNPDGSSSRTKAAGWLAGAYADYIFHPAETQRTVFELSGEMRHRFGNADRDVRQSMAFIAGRKSTVGRGWAAIQQASLATIAGMQLYAVDLPTWKAAFNKSLAEGSTESEAVLFADAILRTSQASGQVKDLSAIQRQKGVMQLMTMFSTFTMLHYNLQVQTLGDVKRRPIKNLPAAVAGMFWLVAIPAVIDAFMRAEGPGDDEEASEEWWALRIARFSFGSVPVIGNPAMSLLEGYDANILKLEALGQKFTSALSSAANMFEEDEELELSDVRKVLEAVGYTAGLGGTAQIVRTLKAIEDEDAGPYSFFVGPKND